MASPSPALLKLMSKVVDGDASYDDLLNELEASQQPDGEQESASRKVVAADAVRPIPGATVDLGRRSRCGFGEVIYGEGKSAELVTQIIQSQLDVGQSALVTRIDSGVAFQVRHSFSFAYYNPLAGTLRVSPVEVPAARALSADEAETTFHAAVVTAGSTDAKIAEQAIETLTWMGVPFQRFDDIGVAGPQRLANAIPRLRHSSAVVVIAGMEGALPAGVAGHLAAPVFAVPTSVGYGANLGGFAAFLGMLNSCAPGLAVVNIDNGFGAACMAMAINKA